MISPTKICGISDPKTLNYILNHPHPPSLIGFICNYKTSPRYVEFDKLRKLLSKVTANEISCVEELPTFAFSIGHKDPLL